MSDKSKNAQQIALMIIGAEKAATTSLLRYLDQHPSLLAHKQREMAFFLRDREWAGGWTRALDRYYPGRSADLKLVGKSVGVLYSLTALERLRVISPESVVVVALRDPVQRAFSSYMMARRKGLERSESFEEAIGLDGTTGQIACEGERYSSYLERGMYSKYLGLVMRTFPQEHIKIVKFEDIRDHPVAACQAIFVAVEGVDPSFRPDTSRTSNVVAKPRSELVARMLSTRGRLRSVKALLRSVLPDRVVDDFRDRLRDLNEVPMDRPHISPATETILSHFYEPYNAALADATSMDLGSWG